MKKEFQAKQITDAQIRIAVRSATISIWAHREDIHRLFPGTPPKVVDAKLRAGVLKGILTGCGSARCHHGRSCPGKFRIVEKEQ